MRLKRSRLGLAVGAALLGVVLASATGAPTPLHRTAPVPQTAVGPSRATPVRARERGPGVAHLHPGKPAISRPHHLFLTRARGPVFDVRKLKGIVVKRERPEHEDPFELPGEADRTEPSGGAALPSTVSPSTMAAASSAPAPGPDSSFDGLDFATWGDGHPPDANGDVGPDYYIQVVNTSIGIYAKATGNRVAAFTFNSFMSQGQFGNLCDTDNFGDPVVVYDTFENRWMITDFAFKLDGSGNVSPQTVYQCFAVSKTGDPVTGGWNFYSILAPGGLADYPKFGVWPDGIYMSANMFGYSATSSYTGFHVWALDKEQMYDDAPQVSVVDFAGDTSDFTVIPANARLQDGTPPAGSPEYFVSTEEFLNALTIYKLHVDWDKISTSTFTGPENQLEPNCWPNAEVADASTPANTLDTLEIRAMAQAQYTNLGGAESLWVTHTVQRGVSATNTTCNAPTGGNATVRWYQANVTGGTVAANVAQGATYDPDGANTFFRFMPSLAVDRAGDMALGYSKSNATTNPQIKYAGRLAGDPLNTLGQTEQTLINGTGSQSGLCGGATCSRWGDYSGMALDPNGCEFWMTNEYYATTGLNDLTRIGSFHFPGCTTVGNGTLSGTVTDGTNPIAGATVSLGSRTTTTNGSGSYSFTVPAGTYPTETAQATGFNPGSASTIAVPDGGTATRNFTLTAAAQSGCFTDNTQSTFQRGVPSDCDLTSTPGSVVLASPDEVDAENTDVNPTGFGFTNTSWAGQTFTPTVSGKLTRVDVELFCSGCTAAGPSITLSIRATTGATPLPTGGDLATASIPGFNDGAAGGLHTFTFASPVTLTAGTRYAFVFRNSAAFASGTMAYTCSCQATGFSNFNPYASGQRVTSTNSGSSWSADTTTGGRDLNFVTYINPGFASSGTFVSSLKDANPAAGRTVQWTTLSFTDSTPASTAVKFQIAGSNSADGPFNYVGPDGTAATFFTTSGADLSQFDGFRYLRYEAFLSSSNPAVTPSLSSVSVCFQDVTSGVLATTITPATASGTYGGTTTLSATLKAGATGVSGKSVSFSINGSSVGGATTNSSGVATLSNVSLAGIAAGSYPTGIAASFAGDSGFTASSGSSSLTVAKADQAIVITQHAPSSAAFGDSFSVAATGGGSGNPVVFGSSGACMNTGSTYTMTGSTVCSVKYDQAGNANYNAAPELTETVNSVKADQAIAITLHAPTSAIFGTSFTVAATGGGSGNPVVFGSSGACTHTGATFTMTSGTGTCTVTYDQAGDSDYNPASELTESVTAQKADEAITVTTHAPAAAAYGASFTADANAPSGPVVFSSAGACTNTGPTFTMTSGTGSCTVRYDAFGDADYNAAPRVTETVTALKVAQSISFAPLPNRMYGSPDFDPGATASSGFAVSYAASGSCSIVGGIVHLAGVGSCSVTASQAGNADYDAAAPVSRAFSVRAPGIVGLKSVSVQTKGGVIDSFDSSAGPYGSSNKGSAATLIANGPVSIAGVRLSGDVDSTRGSVTVAKTGIVSGDVTAGTTASIAGSVAGTVTQSSPSSRITAPSIGTCSRYSGKSGISGKFGYRHGDLKVKRGTVTLARGTYCFHDVTLATDTVLKVQGPVRIRLSGTLAASRGRFVNTTKRVSNLRIESSNSASDGVSLAGGSGAYMTIVAPRTSVALSGGSFFGTMLGKTLLLSGNAAVHQDVH